MKMIINRTNPMGLVFSIAEITENVVQVAFRGKTVHMPISLDEFSQCYFNWQMKGQRIQEAFRVLSDEHREFLMTGITPDEWNEMFKDVEEE